jgi:hypothetical protein
MDSDQVEVNISEKSGFGPGFQDARSWLFRTEYSAILIAIVAYLIWRTFYLGGVDWLQVLFWAVFPDLVSFVAIGAFSKISEWPTWGANFYNLFHTILTWGLVFAATWAVFSALYWPLLGWLVHIMMDRAVGYTLRETHHGKNSPFSHTRDPILKRS